MTPKDSSQVWLARAGRTGEDEAVALELSLAIIGFDDIGDLTDVSDNKAVLERVLQASPGATVNRNRNRAAQLNAFVLRMKEGDIVALPLKTRPGRIALGRITGPYRYQSIDGAKRHTRPVTWLAPDVSRSAFGQDLLYSLGAFLTVCRIERNDAQRRMAAILNGSQDPGSETSERYRGPPAPTKDLKPTSNRRSMLLKRPVTRYLSTLGFAFPDTSLLGWSKQSFRPRVTSHSGLQPDRTVASIYWPVAAHSDLRARNCAYRSRQPPARLT